MGWKTTGDERGKSYRVYKDLEAKYTTLERYVAELQGELERKNVTIRQLAAQLADLASQVGLDATGTPEESVQDAPGQSETVQVLPTPPVAPKAPLRPIVKARTGTLADLLSNASGQSAKKG